MTLLLPNEMPHKEVHEALGAAWTSVNGSEIPLHYGDPDAETAAILQTAGVSDTSYRGRLCLIGGDRVQFLHGQVTNDIKRLAPGIGCYATLVNAKGKMQADMHVWQLQEELLIDLEPGSLATVRERLESHIIADDVQVIDVSADYGQISLVGPASGLVLDALQLLDSGRPSLGEIKTVNHPVLGDLYIAGINRIGADGFDFFVPMAGVAAVLDKLVSATRDQGGRLCGWEASERVRIQSGRPRFGADMTEANLPPEAGLESRAVSYTKGCYIGQEIIARIRTYGQVAKALRRLELSVPLDPPKVGDQLFTSGKPVGRITSLFLRSGATALALGYVRKECFQPGTDLEWRSEDRSTTATAKVLGPTT